MASQFRNESAGNKGTCSRAPEDLGAALRCTVSPMPWSYDSLASGGWLYPHTAGVRGKYGGQVCGLAIDEDAQRFCKRLHESGIHSPSAYSSSVRSVKVLGRANISSFRKAG